MRQDCGKGEEREMLGKVRTNNWNEEALKEFLPTHRNVSLFEKGPMNESPLFYFTQICFMFLSFGFFQRNFEGKSLKMTRKKVKVEL